MNTLVHQVLAAAAEAAAVVGTFPVVGLEAAFPVEGLVGLDVDHAMVACNHMICDTNDNIKNYTVWTLTSVCTDTHSPYELLSLLHGWEVHHRLLSRHVLISWGSLS